MIRRRALVAMAAGAILVGCQNASTSTTVPETTVAAAKIASEPAPKPLDECHETVARLQPEHPPAPGWSIICQMPVTTPGEVGFDWAAWADPADLTVHLTPSPYYTAEYLYLHEVGHTWCHLDGDTSEECADAWASARR